MTFEKGRGRPIPCHADRARGINSRGGNGRKLERAGRQGRAAADPGHRGRGNGRHAALERLRPGAEGALGRAPLALPPADDLAHDVTILLADLRGFSTISASYPGATVLALLNRCFGAMSEIVLRH